MSAPRLIPSRIDDPGEVDGTDELSPPGQVFADLLLLGAWSCQAPAALLSVPQAPGRWRTLSYGFESREGLEDPVLFEALAGSIGPVEYPDLISALPRIPLVSPPHSMRWAYGVALRDRAGQVAGVVVVVDRWVRCSTKREQRALAALARQLGGHLTTVRRPIEARSPEARFSGEATVGVGVARRHRGGQAPTVKPRTVKPRMVKVEQIDSIQLLRSQEVAAYFDVTERTVNNWAAAGKLPSLRTVGGHLRFRRDDVMRLLGGR